MMRSIAAVLMTATLVGCSTPSLSGLGAQGRVPVDGLEGVWRSDDTVVTVEAQADDRYTFTLNGSRAVAEFHVVEIDGHLIADSTLATDENEDWSVDPLLGVYVIPVHKFARIALRGDELDYADLDDDWVAKNAGTSVAKGEDDMTVLTAGPGPLRELLRKAVRDEDAFHSTTTFERLRSAGETQEDSP